MTCVQLIEWEESIINDNITGMSIFLFQRVLKRFYGYIKTTVRHETCPL